MNKDYSKRLSRNIREYKEKGLGMDLQWTNLTCPHCDYDELPRPKIERMDEQGNIEQIFPYFTIESCPKCGWKYSIIVPGDEILHYFEGNNLDITRVRYVYNYNYEKHQLARKLDPDFAIEILRSNPGDPVQFWEVIFWDPQAFMTKGEYTAWKIDNLERFRHDLNRIRTKDLITRNIDPQNRMKIPSELMDKGLIGLEINTEMIEGLPLVKAILYDMTNEDQIKRFLINLTGMIKGLSYEHEHNRLIIEFPDEEERLEDF